jgi:hypothetical protein
MLRQRRVARIQEVKKLWGSIFVNNGGLSIPLSPGRDCGRIRTLWSRQLKEPSSVPRPSSGDGQAGRRGHRQYVGLADTGSFTGRFSTAAKAGVKVDRQLAYDWGSMGCGQWLLNRHADGERVRGCGSQEREEK